MLGTHNSLSYLKPLKWWQRWSTPWSKCQSLTLEEQYNYGVRYFDFRLRYDNNDKMWYFVHNRVKYDIVNNLYFSYLDHQSDKSYIRFILDQRKKPKDKLAEYEIKNFTDYVNEIKRTYKNIIIDSAIIYWTWTDILKPSVIVLEDHTSVKSKWYQYILGTKWYAKKNNRRPYIENKAAYIDDDKVLLLDYIQFFKKT